MSQAKQKSKYWHDRKETIIVFGIMTGLLLPIRLVFVTYISDNWFGSFGLISSISILMIVLIKKGKLGKFGKMFERQMQKMQKGKRAKIIYGQVIFVLIILGGTIIAIEQGNSTYVKLKEQLLAEFQEIYAPDQMIQKYKNIEVENLVNGLGNMELGSFTPQELVAMMAALNDIYHGWILHFYTVGFVESIEVVGILLFYRSNFGKKT